MGVLNVTPDSFSDGYPDPDLAIEQAGQLIADGADIVDVGGESTRPGSDPVSLERELARVLPVIRRLAEAYRIPISVDTRRAEVARAAIEAGAQIVNHVSASLDYRAMIPVLKETGAGYVAMHMRDQPKTMQKKVVYRDVVGEILRQFKVMEYALNEAGVASDRVLFDPGIGFGKKLEHNLAIMSRLAQMFKIMQRPLLMGVSRKSWLTHFFGDALEDMAERDAYTMVAGVFFPFPAVGVHRVHNVRWCRNALDLANRLR